MNIETCINLHIDRRQQLRNAADRLKISVSRLIVLLFHKAMADRSIRPILFSRVRYQERAEKKCWRKFHLVVRIHEYEKMIDLRKLFKFSVSFILALAIEKYLPDLLNEKTETGKITDNYPPCYFFISDFSEFGAHFSIFWTPIEQMNP